MIVCRQRWGFSWWGCLLLFGLILGLGGLGLLWGHTFLATTAPVPARLLVVEGWVKDYAIQQALVEYRSGEYDLIVSTGGPVSGLGGYVNDAQTSASVGAGSLVRLGAPADAVRRVPSRVMGRDRTYVAAVALREWLDAEGKAVPSLNVVTADAHGRRTRLLYQRAFGDSVKVGIISVPSPDYDARHWWRYSEGVREAVGESIAYLYARIFFRPPTKELVIAPVEG